MVLAYAIVGVLCWLGAWGAVLLYNPDQIDTDFGLLAPLVMLSLLGATMWPVTLPVFGVAFALRVLREKRLTHLAAVERRSHELAREMKAVRAERDAALREVERFLATPVVRTSPTETPEP